MDPKEEFSSERSKPSLRGSKNDPEKYQNKELQESIRQNNKKVVGASSIKSLIRSAATRD